MNNRKGFESSSEAAIEDIGGEILAGSGFENEIPESDFSSPELPTESAGR
jgi:hypothetical protein